MFSCTWTPWHACFPCMYFGFQIGMSWECLGLTIPPSFIGTLSPRSKFMNLSYNSSVFSQVASSVGSRFHLTKLFSINRAPFFTYWVSKMALGLRISPPSSLISGKSIVASIVSPFFLSLVVMHGRLDAYGTFQATWVYKPTSHFFFLNLKRAIKSTCYFLKCSFEN